MVTLQDLDVKLSALVTAHSVHRFVGATSATAQGNAGWKGMGDRCQNEFGGTYSSVRVCFSEEIMRTPSSAWPSLSGASGFWVHPSFQPLAAGTTGANYGLDASGNSSGLGYMTCIHWTYAQNDGSGLALDSTGAFKLLPCDGNLGVACCAP